MVRTFSTDTAIELARSITIYCRHCNAAPNGLIYQHNMMMQTFYPSFSLGKIQVPPEALGLIYKRRKDTFPPE